ncbi:TetR family transcriptional regulator [Paenarthrobacter nicotinovorans]
MSSALRALPVRVDQVAAAAGINKERIYQYFGRKEALFGAVLSA